MSKLQTSTPQQTITMTITMTMTMLCSCTFLYLERNGRVFTSAWNCKDLSRCDRQLRCLITRIFCCPQRKKCDRKKDTKTKICIQLSFVLMIDNQSILQAMCVMTVKPRRNRITPLARFTNNVL